MRYLGIDFGKKNIGIAISDDNGKIAFPFEVLENKEKIAKDIKKICEKNKVSKVIIGRPAIVVAIFNDKNKKTVDVFASSLKAEGIDMDFMEEIFTTKIAEKYLREAGKKNIAKKKRLSGGGCDFAILA